MLSLGQLVTPITQAQALQTLLTSLGQLGFNTASWQSGAWQLTFLNLIAQVWSQLSNTVSNIAAGGFTTTAATTALYNYLVLLAQYFYNIEPIQATPTVGSILLTSSAAASSNTFGVGTLIVADQPNGTPGANVYTNTTGGSLGPSSTLLLSFAANVAGTQANIAPNTALYLWTPVAGVAATNPPVSGSSTWITTPGTDQESPARLAARCIYQWSMLSYGNINGAYSYWALTALPALTRLQVASSPGNGNVTLYGATAAGPISSGQITTIENYINGVTDGVGRRPINDIFTAVAAGSVTSPTITLTVYCLPSVAATIAATVTAALVNYIGSIPLGGTILTNPNQGYILNSGLAQTVEAQTGIVDYSFSGLPTNPGVALSAGQLYAPTINVTVQPISPVLP